MAETLYNIAESLRRQILSSPDREKTASEFFSSHTYSVGKDDIIVLSDGTPIIKNDPGRDYDKDELQRLKDGISEQLDLFGDIDLQSQRDDGKKAKRNRAGKRRTTQDGIYPRGNPILRDGVSAYYSPEKGWSGKEQHPWTVKGAWDKFGFVDFLGMDVRNVHDIAQMFSIYRNPMLEYFHIILAKDGRIVRQMAMTSGLSGLVKVIPQGGVEELKKTLSEIDYDAAYLVHNHPSGNITPSVDDLQCTAVYINEVFRKKFIGHIILDHDKFTLIAPMKPMITTFSDYSITDLAYTPHEIPTPKTKSSRRIASPSDVAKIVFDLHCKGNVTIDLDNDNKVRSFSPFSVEKYDPVLFMFEMKRECIRNRIIIVTTEEDFQKIEEKFNELPRKPGGGYRQPVLDCIYIDTEKGSYRSMLEYGLIETFNWQSFLAKITNSNQFIWNEDIADHPKQGYLFESVRPYQSYVLSPKWKDLDTYNEKLSSYQGKGSIPIQDSSSVLEALGYPEGKVCLSESAIENARKDRQKKGILQIVPQIISDPAAIIDTGIRVREGSRNCLLFAYNASIDDSPATVALLVEPVEMKRRTEYIVQMAFSPEEVSRDENKLFIVCAMNKQFIYSDLEKPFFIIPGSSPNEMMKTTKIRLKQEIPHKTAVIDYCLNKAIRRARR